MNMLSNDKSINLSKHAWHLLGIKKNRSVYLNTISLDFNQTIQANSFQQKYFEIIIVNQ